MKRSLLLIFIIFFSSYLFAQKPCNSFECVVQRINLILKSNNENKYKEALENINKAEAYIINNDPKKKQVISTLRSRVFDSIEAERKTAILEKKNADLLTKNATAMYWASEAEKINPIQGLNLLETALQHTNDETVAKYIESQTEKVFSYASSHQFRERFRIEDCNSFSEIKPNEFLIKSYNSFKEYYFKGYNEESNEEENIEELFLIKVDELANLFTSKKIHDNELISTIISPDKSIVVNVFTDSLQVINKSKNTSKFFPFIYSNFDSSFFTEDMIWFVLKSNRLNMSQTVFLPDLSADNDNLYEVSQNGKFKFVRSNYLGSIDFIEVSTDSTPSFLKKEIPLQFVEISRNGKYLLTKNNLKRYKVWNLESQSEINLFKNEKILTAHFSDNSEWIIIKKEDKTLLPIKINTQESIPFIKDYSRIKKLFFSPTGKWLIEETDTKTRLWNIKSRKSYDYLDGSNIENYFFSSNENWLITLDSDFSAKLWDLTQREIDEKINIYDDDFPYISPNSHWLITEKNDNNCQLINLKENTQALFPIAKPIKKVVYSYDESYAALIFKDSTSQIIKLNQKTKIDLINHERDVVDVVISPLNNYILVKNNKSEIQIYDVAVNSVLRKFDNIDSVFFSKNGRYLAMLDYNRLLTVVDLSIDAKTINLSENTKPILSANFSYNSNHFLVQYFDNKANIWNLNDISVIIKPYKFLAEQKQVYSTTFSQVGGYLVVRYLAAPTKIFRLNDGSELKNSKWQDFRNAHFSPEDSFVAIRKRNDIEIWDISSDIHTFIYSTPITSINQLTFTTDSKFFIYKQASRYSYIDVVARKKLKSLSSIADVYAFNSQSKILSIGNENIIFTYDIAQDKIINTLYLNFIPNKISYIDSERICINSEQAIVVADVSKQGSYNVFTNQSITKMKYDFLNIENWKSIFRKKFLLPLDTHIIEKYKIPQKYLSKK